jgi:transcriptional regulator with XRE-family HTH domain
MSYASPIGRLMARHGLKDAKVAAAIGVTPQAVNLWRHGNAEPNARLLVALADHFRTFDASIRERDLLMPKVAA